jgi:hypothetical protein
LPEPQKVALVAVGSAAPAPMLEHLALAAQHVSTSVAVQVNPAQSVVAVPGL